MNELQELKTRVADLEAIVKTQSEMLSGIFDDINKEMQHVTNHLYTQIKKDLSK